MNPINKNCNPNNNTRQIASYADNKNTATPTKQSNKTEYFSSLNPQLISKIVSELNVKDAISLSQTSTMNRDIVNKDNKSFWENEFSQTFGINLQEQDKSLNFESLKELYKLVSTICNKDSKSLKELFTLLYKDFNNEYRLADLKFLIYQKEYTAYFDDIEFDKNYEFPKSNNDSESNILKELFTSLYKSFNNEVGLADLKSLIQQKGHDVCFKKIKDAAELLKNQYKDNFKSEGFFALKLIHINSVLRPNHSLFSNKLICLKHFFLKEKMNPTDAVGKLMSLTHHQELGIANNLSLAEVEQLYRNSQTEEDANNIIGILVNHPKLTVNDFLGIKKFSKMDDNILRILIKQSRNPPKDVLQVFKQLNDSQVYGIMYGLSLEEVKKLSSKYGDTDNLKWIIRSLTDDLNESYAADFLSVNIKVFTESYFEALALLVKQGMIHKGALQLMAKLDVTQVTEIVTLLVKKTDRQHLKSLIKNKIDDLFKFFPNLEDCDFLYSFLDDDFFDEETLDFWCIMEIFLKQDMAPKVASKITEKLNSHQKFGIIKGLSLEEVEKLSSKFGDTNNLKWIINSLIRYQQQLSVTDFLNIIEVFTESHFEALARLVEQRMSPKYALQVITKLNSYQLYGIINGHSLEEVEQLSYAETDDLKWMINTVNKYREKLSIVDFLNINIKVFTQDHFEALARLVEQGLPPKTALQIIAKLNVTQVAEMAKGLN